MVQDKKNIDFIQMDREGMNSMRELIMNNPTAGSIFMFLSQKMDNKNAISCSQVLLQEVVGKSRVTVSRAIKYLEQEGFLMILKQGNCNVYIMNPDIVWSSWRTNRKYCEFEGKVLVSKSENKNIENKLKKFKSIILKGA